jgi:hypothetical protein
LKKQALKQRQLVAGQLLKMKTKKSGGDRNVSNACINANPGLLTELK